MKKALLPILALILAAGVSQQFGYDITAFDDTANTVEAYGAHTPWQQAYNYENNAEGEALDIPQPEGNKTASAVLGCRRYEVTLTITGQDSPKPVDVMLVMDRSGSMDDGGHGCTLPGYDSQQACGAAGGVWGPQPITSAKEAAKTFIDQLRDNDRVGLVNYSASATLNEHLTTDHQAVKDAVDDLTASRHTNIADAIYEATQELNNNGREDIAKALIVLSDGVANRAYDASCNVSTCGTYPCASTCCTQDAVNQAQAAKDQGYRMFSIFLSNVNSADRGCTEETVTQLGNNTMQAIASGPDYFYSTSTQSDLEEIYNEIAGEVNPAFTDVRVIDEISNCFGNVTNITVSKGNASYDSGDHTITWDVSDLGSTQHMLTYGVTAAAACCSPDVEVNRRAVITYTYENVTYEKEFPNPIVDVECDPYCHINCEPEDCSVCEGGTVTLTEDGGYGVSWEWSTGDAGNTTVVNQSGNYSVIITDENGCTSYCEKQVEVYQVPYCHISCEPEDCSVCEGGTVTLTEDGGDGVSWE